MPMPFRTFWNDLRYALRQLRRSPGFALTVVLTLALGVGANAIVFSVLNALVLKPLPVPNARQLVSLNRTGNTGSYSSSPSQSYPDYRDLRDGNRAFSGLAAYAIQRAGVRVGGSVRQSWFYEASENYFDVLGTRPALGRFFHPSDAHGPNSSPYVVLSYAFWQREFGSDPHVPGRVIELNKQPLTVLGVAPPEFAGTELYFHPDFWMPMQNEAQIDEYSYLETRGSHNIWVLGRLKPGMEEAQAQADLNTEGKRMAAAHPVEDGNLQFHLSRPGLVGDTLGKPIRAFLWGIMALAGLVLLAACANLGGLFAARAADRAREFAVRLAMGAGRGRVALQLLTEAVAVSLIGGALGLALAETTLRLLSAWHPSPDFPIGFDVHADTRTSVLALGLAVVSGVLFGLLPLRRIWRSHAYQVIKSGLETGGGRGRWTLRDGLLVLQIVLCSVLVTSSLVAVRGLARSLDMAYGFQPRGAMLASLDWQMSGHTDEQALALQHRALDRIATTPGVAAAGYVDRIPLNLSSSDSNIYPEGTTDFRDSNARADANLYDISPGYLAAAETRLVAGRDFTWHDDAQASLVAIVNRTLARRMFGTSNAIGRYLVNGGKRRQVVGIAEDGKYNTLTEDPTAALFLPSTQRPDTAAVFVVRSHAGEAATAAALQDIFKKLDPDLPVKIGSWQQVMNMELLPSIAATVALGIMGGLAAMLAVTGIFGMASYSVSRRMRELGLRVALGADRGQLLKAALGRPARLLLVGSVAGIALGAAASRLLAHIVYSATSQDPVVLLGVIVCMALLALLATWLPARRALSADPAQLLREE